jgi:hypothetical protein
MVDNLGYALEQTIFDGLMLVAGWAIGLFLIGSMWFIGGLFGSPVVYALYAFMLCGATFFIVGATRMFQDDYDRLLKLWGIRKW